MYLCIMYVSINQSSLYLLIYHSPAYLCICVSIHVSICIYVSIIYGSNNHLCIYLCIYVCTNQSSVYLCPCVCMHYLCIYLYSHLCIYQSFYAPICVSVCYLSQEMFLEFYFNIVPPWTSGLRSSLVAQTVKHLPTMRKTRVQSLGREDPLEKEMATHSSILAWRIPETEEPSGLPSMESHRVRHN